MRTRQPGPADDPTIKSFLETVAAIRAERPGAPLDDTVKEVTHRLRTIASACEDRGLDPTRYLAALGQLGELAGDVDVSDVYWRNPTLEEVVADNFDPGLGQMSGPTVTEIFGEWELTDPLADQQRWLEGMQRYDAGSLDNRSEMRAAAELMCHGLSHALPGNAIMPGDDDSAQASLIQTAWNVLVATLHGNDEQSWGPESARQLRLALAVTRLNRWQSSAFGGDGAFADIFEDTGNQMIMAMAVSDTPWDFNLRAWFEQ